MKQILRLLILAAIVVLIGFGVWAIFFQKDNDTKLYNTLTTMMDIWEEKEEETLPGYTLYDEVIFHESATKTQDISQSMSLLGTGHEVTDAEGTYASVHEAQMSAIKYYYSLMQFADNVKSGDAKNIKKKVDALTQSLKTIRDHIDKIALYQDSVKKASMQNKDVLYLELSNMYKNLVKDYKNYLAKQNDIAHYMKKLVTAYVFGGSYLYDAKGAMVESFLYAADVVLSKEIASDDCQNSLNDMRAMYKQYTTTDEVFFNKNSADFTTSYLKLVETEKGQEELKKIFAALPKEQYQGKQQLVKANPETDVELFSFYGFGSDYYQDVINILKFLIEV